MSTTASSGRSLPGWLRRPPVTAAVAGLGLVALAGLGQLAPQPTGGAVPPTTEPLASGELVCGGTMSSRSVVSTVSAAVVPTPAVTSGRATVAALTLKAVAAKPTVLTAKGATTTRRAVGAAGPAQLAQARGSFAAGLAADQQLLATAGTSRGLAISPCAAPVSDTWLVGGGATIGRLTQVLLTNDDDRAAQVDLEVYAPSGPVVSTAFTGIVVPPSSRRVVSLSSLSPGTASFVVHVITRVGRVSALGLDESAVGLIPQGVTYLPPTSAGKRLVIPEVMGTSSTSRLLLLAPELDAAVTVRLITNDGTIIPVGLDSLDVQSGKVLSVDLAPAAAGQDAGLLITSDHPVVVGAEVRIGVKGQVGDSDAVAAVPALTGPALVSGVSGAGRQMIVLSAPGRASSVKLELFLSGTTTPSWSTVVKVPAGTQVPFVVPVKAGTADAMLLVTPQGGGAVYAARRVDLPSTGGPLISTAPLLPRRSTAVVPGVASVPGSSVR
jgi:hypothetical protein